MEATDLTLKVKEMSKEIKKLNNTIKELKVSRDQWKRKSMEHKSRADKLEDKFIRLKENINKVLSEFV